MLGFVSASSAWSGHSLHGDSVASKIGRASAKCFGLLYPASRNVKDQCKLPYPGYLHKSLPDVT